MTSTMTSAERFPARCRAGMMAARMLGRVNGRGEGWQRRGRPLGLLRDVGPEIVAGASDNDPTNVGAAAVVGAQTGYRLCWVALLVAPLWLACHRLWLALIGWIVVVAAVDAGMTALHAGGMMIFLANVLLALLMGLEAASLRRAGVAPRR